MSKASDLILLVKNDTISIEIIGDTCNKATDHLKINVVACSNQNYWFKYCISWKQIRYRVTWQCASKILQEWAIEKTRQ